MAAVNLVTTDYAQSYLGRLGVLLRSLDTKQISQAGELLAMAREEGRQVFICGNGGSAAAASHMAVDLGKGASRNRPKRFKVMSLTDNVPWLTALGNDLSYDDVFVEQFINFAQKGDVLLAISASGNSKNILKVVQQASKSACHSIGISGGNGGHLKDMVNVHVHVKSEHMGMIEDCQLIIAHLLCYGFIDAEGAG